MKKDYRIMELSIPVPEAADLTSRAAQAGIPTDKYIGIQALAGAYGHSHPEVIAFHKRAKAGINGTKTQDDDRGES